MSPVRLKSCQTSTAPALGVSVAGESYGLPKHCQSLVIYTAADSGSQRLDQAAEVVEVLVEGQRAIDGPRVRDRAWYRRIAIVVEQPGLISGEEIVLQLRVQL